MDGLLERDTSSDKVDVGDRVPEGSDDKDSVTLFVPDELTDSDRVEVMDCESEKLVEVDWVTLSVLVLVTRRETLCVILDPSGDSDTLDVVVGLVERDNVNSSLRLGESDADTVTSSDSLTDCVCVGVT